MHRHTLAVPVRSEESGNFRVFICYAELPDTVEFLQYAEAVANAIDLEFERVNRDGPQPLEPVIEAGICLADVNLGTKTELVATEATAVFHLDAAAARMVNFEGDQE